ncbi:MAG: sigma-54 dependent transcriptional regulator [Candidatus Korobacteraceae bacterium]|jgi:DNA-binding NtrC family response regulator
MTAARNIIPIPALRGTATILIATPNASLRKRLGDALRKAALVEDASSGAEALSILERRGARILVLDRKLPDLNSDELIGVVERQFPCTDVVLLDSGRGTIEIPEELRANADYRCLQEFNISPEHFAPPPAEASACAAPENASMLLPGIVGACEAMRQLAVSVRAVARHSTSVLITGETGSGKELVAAAVHKLSTRAERPFITINCAAIPETLIEAELFGHTRGAFTGAVQSRLGKIHAAQGGTIFFDEIGELPIASQSKLLRFLECGEVQRLGTSDVFRLDARVVAATNVDLERRMREGLFREDLFYRLSVFPIELAPLRERLADIPLLARHFMERLTGSAEVKLSPETEAKLVAHSWPGNVRELRNVIERAFVLAGGRTMIAPEQIMMRKPCASVRVASESS